jgi:hypothetical protein
VRVGVFAEDVRVRTAEGAPARVWVQARMVGGGEEGGGAEEVVMVDAELESQRQTEPVECRSVRLAANGL